MHLFWIYSRAYSIFHTHTDKHTYKCCLYALEVPRHANSFLRHMHTFNVYAYATECRKTFLSQTKSQIILIFYLLSSIISSCDSVKHVASSGYYQLKQRIIIIVCTDSILLWSHCAEKHPRDHGIFAMNFTLVWSTMYCVYTIHMCACVLFFRANTTKRLCRLLLPHHH